MIDDDRLERYLDHRGSEAERERLEEALADDAALRARLVVLHRARQAAAGAQVPAEVRAQAESLAGSAPARSWWSAGRGAVAAVAAALVAVLGLWWVRFDSPVPGENEVVQRQGPAPRIDAVELIAPADDADHRGVSIAFRWRPVAEAVSYTVVIVDLEGDVQLRRETADDTLVVQASEGVRAGAEVLFWYVEARLVSGEAVSSSLRRLRWRLDPVG